MSQHAFLSPSASHRWLNCPPSAKLCASEKDHASSYALEGTDAHTLCAHLVERALGRDSPDPIESLTYYNSQMQECGDGYASFVMEELQKLQMNDPDAKVLIEQKVDYSHWVPDGTGTADCIILSKDTLEIIDYKYGQGVLVHADSAQFGGNPQLMCYSLGAIARFDDTYHFQTVRMVIYQPRLKNISVYEMTKQELLLWADTVLAPTAALAMEGKGEFKAGEHCRFCKVKSTCLMQSDYRLLLAKKDFLTFHEKGANTMPKFKNLTKVITGPNTIFSYLNCWDPKANQGGSPKFSVSLIIPKSDVKTIQKINDAIQAAYDEGQNKLKGSGKSVPALSTLKTPLRDGDLERPDDANYKNSYFINANSSTAPGIVDADCNPIIERSEMYSGVKGRASISLYAYNVNGNRGIACGLNNLQKLSDGTPLGGRSRAEDDFSSADEDDFLN